VALILTSCGTEPEEEEGKTINCHRKSNLPPEREKEEAKEVYRRETTIWRHWLCILGADIPGFDEAFIQHMPLPLLHLTNEEMLLLATD